MDSLQAPTENKRQINKIALVDADFIKYVVTYNLGQDPDIKSGLRHATQLEIQSQTDQLLNEVLTHIEPVAMIYCFSGKTSDGYRFKIAQHRQYKGGRIAKPSYPNEKEYQAQVLQYVMDTRFALLVNDLEADDLLSMLQKDYTFVASRDKDLMQVPGWHWSFDNDDLIYIDPIEAHTFLMWQMLVGDSSTDNITGLELIGAVKAKKIMDNVPVEELSKTILSEYIKKYNVRRGLDFFVENYSLLRLIFDRGEYNRIKYADAFEVIEKLQYKIKPE